MDRLVKDLLAAPAIPQTFSVEAIDAVRASISSFSSIVPKFQSILRVGVEQLFNQLLRPKLRTLLTDVYKDVSYVLDEDAYTAAEYQDVVRKRFVKAWEGLVDGYKVRDVRTGFFTCACLSRTNHMLVRTRSLRTITTSSSGLPWKC